jgi:hypothetical protein
MASTPSMHGVDAVIQGIDAMHINEFFLKSTTVQYAVN